MGVARAVAAGSILLATTLLVPAVAAVAAGIVGTERAETIHGTPQADRIFGRGGNDVLVGGGGRDVVDGGRGADRLSLRDGERDTAICGPGNDVVLADRLDVVHGDCEDLRIVPPDPPAPPSRPVVAGVYGGRTTQGELVSFQVSTGGELSRLALPALHLSCGSTWSHDFGAKTTVIRRDGTFSMSESGTRQAAAYAITVSGLLTVGIATGGVEVEVELADETCTARGLGWTAAAAVLTGP